MAGKKPDTRDPKSFSNLQHTCTDCGEYLTAEETATRMLDSDPNTIYYFHRNGCPGAHSFEQEDLNRRIEW